MTGNLSLYGGWSPRNPWPVDRLKAFKSFLKALKAQKRVTHRPERPRTTWPRWGRIHAPEGAGEVSGDQSSNPHTLCA